MFKWVLILSAIGVCTGSASALFLITLEEITILREENLWLIYFLPLAGLLIGLTYHYYGKNIVAGNNLLIENIHHPKGIIPFKMAPFIYLGTLITHLFGGSAGREGTAIQMAGAIADQFSKPFRLSKNERVFLIIAGVAAGFGSVFGTPLAGTVFAVTFFAFGKFKFEAILPAVITAWIANYTTHFWEAKHTEYVIESIPNLSVLNLFYTLLAGAIFGLCAWLFSRLSELTSSTFKKRISYPPLRPFVGGLIVLGATLLIGNTRYIGLGVPIIVEAFDLKLLPYDFMLKLMFTVLTLSAGFKGGEVTPLFFIGATLGNALVLILPLPISLLAGMGFVAVFAGATNTPLACTIMALELFGVSCGVYVAIACYVAYYCSGHTGIYSSQIIGRAKYFHLSYLKGKKIGDL